MANDKTYIAVNDGYCDIGDSIKEALEELNRQSSFDFDVLDDIEIYEAVEISARIDFVVNKNDN